MSSPSSQGSEDSYNPPHLQSAIYNDEEAPPELESPEINKEKSCLYLSSFWRISFDWDEKYVSDSLKLLKSDSQNETQAIPLPSMTGKVCKAVNQQHFFKSAFGT